jgi:glyoxylase-like metal-dependent hydrolase (beta-lactamase superfamily II)
LYPAKPITIATILLAGCITAVPAGDADAFQVQTLEPGIHLFRPVSARGYTNSLVFERNDGLLVVDAQPNPSAARDLLAAIARVSAGPVRYLVFSHPHADSSGGSPAFPEGTLRIATLGYRDAVADPEYDFRAETKARWGEESGPSLSGPPQATLVLFGRTRLEDPSNPLILLPISHAHSPGDLLVFQPDAGVVAAGDLLFHAGNPFAGHARVSTWLAQLNHLITMAPKWVVPMRGSVREPGQIRKQRDALIWLRGQVEEAFVDKTAADEIPGLILQSDQLSRHFHPGAGRELLRGLIVRQVEETLEQRKRMGLE